MTHTENDPWSVTKTVVVAWFSVACVWSVKRFVSEAIEETELGWGPVAYLVEMIYIALLGGVLLLFASFRDGGMKGSSAIILCTLLGSAIPAFSWYRGEPIQGGLILAFTVPGFLLGCAYAWLRKRHVQQFPPRT